MPMRAFNNKAFLNTLALQRRCKEHLPVRNKQKETDYKQKAKGNEPDLEVTRQRI